LLKPY